MNSKDSGITRGKRRIRGGVVNDRKQAVCGVSEFGDLLVIACEGRVSWNRDHGLCFRPADPSVKSS